MDNAKLKWSAPESCISTQWIIEKTLSFENSFNKNNKVNEFVVSCSKSCR